MATGILGLGSSGSNGLSQEFIDKLKAAEAKSKIDPITTKLTTWDTELEKITVIETKVKELLTAISNYDLYKSTPNAFNQVTANTSGSSAVFSATDVTGLTPGSTTITVTQLAQRDVYQTNTFTDKDTLIGESTLSIKVGGVEAGPFSTTGKTYQQLADDINLKGNLKASVEQVGDSEYRLVIKSKESGEANKLTVSGGFGSAASSTISDFATNMVAGQLTINGDDIPITSSMNYDDVIAAITNSQGGNKYTASKAGNTIEIKANDGSSVSVVETGDNGLNFQNTSHVVSAQNMKASIDGVAYNVSSNTITIQGNLAMTAVELGNSTISIQSDTSTIAGGLEDFVAKYNELTDLINAESFAEDSSLSDIGSFKTIMGTIKNALFANYGPDEDENIFNYGFSLDATGHIAIDSTVFATAVTNDTDGLKSLFIGVAEKPGLGTVLKEYLDGLDGYDGALTLYGTQMADNKTKLEADKIKAQELLDSKYSLMAQQFASYTALITQMEASFSGLKMMISESTSGS